MYKIKTSFSEQIHNFIQKEISVSVVQAINNIFFNNGCFCVKIDKCHEGAFIDFLFLIEMDALSGLPHNDFFKRKTLRLREKGMDQNRKYELDILERRILAEALYQEAASTVIKLSKVRAKKAREQIIMANLIFVGLSEEDALRFVKVITNPASVLYEKANKNLLFNNDDWKTFFNDGFFSGISNLASQKHEISGYGMDYTLRIFKDVGITNTEEIRSTIINMENGIWPDSWKHIRKALLKQ